MPKPRACENWLRTFLDWTLPVSEAPESLLIWTGLFCISAVLKRDVRFSKEWTKQYDIFPTNYLMFVGPPGVVRKSTSAGYGQRVIEEMNRGLSVTSPAYVNFGPTSGSHVAIMDKMSETVDGSMTIIAGEFGNIVSTMPGETFTYFQKMFDADGTAAKYEHSTRGTGNVVIKDPSLNIFGCTIPDWITENSGYMVRGGFAARTVFVFENKKRQSRLFYKDVGPSVKELDGMKKKLAIDLARIGKLKGEARPETDKLTKRMEDWYQEYENAPVERGVETFKARKHIHTLRTAMLISLCERDDLIITSKHFNQALELIEDVESKLSRGLSSVGRNPASNMLYEVLDYILANAPVKKNKVSAYFFKDVSMEQMSQIFEVLKASEEIEELTVDGTLRRKRKK